MKYSDQLKTVDWEIKRNEILERDGFKCKLCKETNNLNVHHFYYMSNLKAWEYPNEALITYCETCHNKWHEFKLKLDKELCIDFIELSLMFNIIKKLKILDTKNIAILNGFLDDLFNFAYNFNN
jgi:hypothetical protein